MGSPVVITPDPPSQSAVTITPDPPKRTWMDSAGDAIKEWWNQVNPAEGLRGLDQMTRHPIDTGTKMLQSQDEARVKAEQSFKNGDYATGVRHFLNYMLPILGPASDKAGDQLQNGETAKGIGTTAGILTNIGTPALADAAVARMGPTAARVALLGRTPAEAYQSALKPSTTLSETQRANIVNTGLQNKIPVSAKGLEDLKDLITDVNSKMDAAIPANSPAVVNKFAVASRLGSVADRFKTQVNPEADLNAVGESGNEFLRNQPGEIPAKDAAAVKSGTYRQIGSKNYGELGTAVKESQKALARGIKEELIQHFPELQSLGLEDQKLLALEPLLEKAVSRIGNHQLMGIGTPIAASATKAITGSGGLAAVAGTLKLVLDNPVIKSRLAIALSKSGVAPVAAFQRVNAYQQALRVASGARAPLALSAAHESADQSPDQSTGEQP